MLNIDHFRTYVVRPALMTLSVHIKPSDCAEELLINTAIVESGLTYFMQCNSSYRNLQNWQPGLGLWQIKPYVHRELFTNYLYHRRNLHLAVLQNIINKNRKSFFFQDRRGDETAIVLPDDQELVVNLHYACIIARLIYYRAQGKLPRADDIEGQAVYWSEHFCTQDSEELVEYFESKVQWAKRSWKRAS